MLQKIRSLSLLLFSSGKLVADFVEQDLYIFVCLQVELEQYPTGPHIASRMLFTVNFLLSLLQSFLLLLSREVSSLCD